MIALLLQTQRIGPAWVGVVIPAFILLLSCWVTWALYKHFSEGGDGESD